MQKRPPAQPPSPRRRNHSRQRAFMLEWLRSTDSHPTALQIQDALRPEFPSLSLGTVYRNLEILIAESAVSEVACGRGPSRYDGNPRPHHHFICDRCERIVDVDLAVPRGLAKRLRGEHGLRARRLSIDFFGFCPACELRPGSNTDQPGTNDHQSGINDTQMEG